MNIYFSGWGGEALGRAHCILSRLGPILFYRFPESGKCKKIVPPSSTRLWESSRHVAPLFALIRDDHSCPSWDSLCHCPRYRGAGAWKMSVSFPNCTTVVQFSVGAFFSYTFSKKMRSIPWHKGSIAPQFKELPPTHPRFESLLPSTHFRPRSHHGKSNQEQRLSSATHTHGRRDASCLYHVSTESMEFSSGLHPK